MKNGTRRTIAVMSAFTLAVGTFVVPGTAFATDDLSIQTYQNSAVADSSASTNAEEANAITNEDELENALKVGGDYILEESFTVRKPLAVGKGINFNLNLNSETITLCESEEGGSYGAFELPNTSVATEITIFDSNDGSGKIEVAGDNAREAFKLGFGSTLNLSGGTYVSLSEAPLIKTGSGVLNILAGTLNAKGSVINIDSPAKVSILDGALSSESGNAIEMGATAPGWNRPDSGAHLTIGEKGSNAGPTISGLISIPASNMWVADFYSGIIDGVCSVGLNAKLPITSEESCASLFEENIANYLPDGFICEPANGPYYQVREDSISSKPTADSVAIIERGDQRIGLNNLGGVSSHLQAGDTLKIMKDVDSSVPGGILNISVPGVTIDLNGHSIKGSGETGYGINVAIMATGDDEGPAAVTIINSDKSHFAAISNVKTAIGANGSGALLKVIVEGDIQLEGNPSAITLSRSSCVLYNENMQQAESSSNGIFCTTLADSHDYLFSDLGMALGESADSQISLVKSYEIDSPFVVRTDAKGTLDLGGHTITSSGDSVIEVAASNVDLVVRNGSLKSTSESSDPMGVSVVAPGNGSYSGINLLLEKIELEMSNDGVALYVNGNNTDARVTVKDSSITTGDGGMGIYFPPDNSTLSLQNATITAGTGVGVKGGKVDINKGTVITAKGEKQNASAEQGGIISSGDAIYVEANYDRDIAVDINGGTFKSTHGSAVRTYIASDYNEKATVNIAGGSFEASSGVPAVSVEVAEGGNSNAASTIVSGGTFSDESAKNYVAPGLSATVDSEGNLIVYRPYVPPASSEEAVVVAQPENGSVTVAPEKAEPGDKVTVTATPDEGYEVSSVEVTDASGEAVEVTENADGTWTFEMPSSQATVEVTFAEAAWESPFADVAEGDWFYPAVRFAVEGGYMRGYAPGYDLFGPYDVLTRGQMVQVLYNAEGCPEAAYAGTFSDVPEGSTYADAVEWAASAGVAEGYEGAGEFGPDDPMTREQMAAFMCRYAQLKGADVSADPSALDSYPDAGEVSGWAQAEMAWAVGSGVIHGVGGSELQPGAASVRAYVAQMVMNYFGGAAAE